MILDPRDHSRRIAAAALLALLAAATVAQAQVTPHAPVQDDEPIDDAPNPASGQAARPGFWVDETIFDRWIFGPGGSSAIASDRFKTTAMIEIDAIERACPLTKAQRARLRVAAQGDIKRLMERIEVERRKFRLAVNDEPKFNEFFKAFQPLIVEFQRGPFGDRSLFARTLKSTLDEAQTEALEESARERKQYFDRTSVDQAINLIDAAVGLSEAQRRRVAALIHDETRPPRNSGSFDCYVVMLQLAKIPEARIKPIFSESQWTLLGTQFEIAHLLAPHLTKNGFLPDDPPAPAPAPKAADARK